MNETGVVYGLHAGDGVIRYIDQTTRPRHRLYEHRKSSRAGDPRPTYDWTRTVGDKNIVLIVLSHIMPAEELLDAEARMIKQCEDYGMDLTNIPEKEWRRRVASSNTGQRRSAEVRAAMSAARRGKPGKPKSEEEKERMRQRTLGMKHTEESLAKMRLHQHTRWHTNRNITKKGCTHCEQ